MQLNKDYEKIILLTITYLYCKSGNVRATLISALVTLNLFGAKIKTRKYSIHVCIYLWNKSLISKIDISENFSKFDILIFHIWNLVQQTTEQTQVQMFHNRTTEMILTAE